MVVSEVRGGFYCFFVTFLLAGREKPIAITPEPIQK